MSNFDKQLSFFNIKSNIYFFVTNVDIFERKGPIATLESTMHGEWGRRISRKRGMLVLKRVG